MRRTLLSFSKSQFAQPGNVRNAVIKLIAFVFLCNPLLSHACYSAEATQQTVRVIENYAALAEAVYADSLTTAIQLEKAIDRLLAHPNEQTLTAARDAWRAARIPYSQSEALRFYGGPIDGRLDNQNNIEMHLNAWPLDENYIESDSIAVATGTPNTIGIIDNTNDYRRITPQLLLQLNMQGSRRNVASGYHAVEFLLWGRDHNDPPDSAGNRPFTDYVVGRDGRGLLAKRRADYLKAAAQLIVRDLTIVHQAWIGGKKNNYRNRFIHDDPKQSLTRMLTGMTALAEIEMATERMNAALITGDQEDEQSCFSDNSLRDLRNNALGIDNIYFGRYRKLDGSAIEGPNLDQLFASIDSELADEIRQRLDRTRRMLEQIHEPFDQEILSTNTDGHRRVLAAISSLHAESQSILAASRKLGLQVNPMSSEGD